MEICQAGIIEEHAIRKRQDSGDTYSGDRLQQFQTQLN